VWLLKLLLQYSVLNDNFFQTVKGEQKEGFIKAMLDGDLLTSLKTRIQQKDCSVELGVQLIAEMAKTGKFFAIECKLFVKASFFNTIGLYLALE